MADCLRIGKLDLFQQQGRFCWVLSESQTLNLISNRVLNVTVQLDEYALVFDL